MNEKSCLGKFAFESAKISSSCRWVTDNGAVTTELQDVYTQYGATWFSNITSPKGANATSFSLKVTLPSSAKNKWTGYLVLEAGPQNKNPGPGASYMNPKRSFTFSGCQTSTSCQVKQTIPQNVTSPSTFLPTGFGFTAITTDAILINQYNSMGYVDDTYPFKLRMLSTTTYATDGVPPVPPASTPAISDNIQFGPTSYIMDTISPIDATMHYSVLTYKSYEITRVTGANWTVTVGASLASNKKKTSITSLLMTEKNYLQYMNSNCTTTCAPPTSLAIKGTVCTGLTCSKNATKLSATQRYRLVVSYPTLTSLNSATAYSKKTMTSTFNKEMVKTEIFATGWKLPTKRRRRRSVVTSGQRSIAKSTTPTGRAIVF